MKYLLIPLLILFSIVKINAQCSVTLSYTPASCPTCCDGCVTVNVVSGCPPYTVSWYPSDPTFPVPCGACADTTYIATITDNCACTAADTIQVTGTTGINSSNKGAEVSIYPNPSNENIIIKCNMPGQENLAVFTDNYGNEILQVKLGDETTILNTNSLPTGIYFIIIYRHKQVVLTEKWIKI